MTALIQTDSINWTNISVEKASEVFLAAFNGKVDVLRVFPNKLHISGVETT